MCPSLTLLEPFIFSHFVFFSNIVLVSLFSLSFFFIYIFLHLQPPLKHTYTRDENHYSRWNISCFYLYVFLFYSFFAGRDMAYIIPGIVHKSMIHLTLLKGGLIAPNSKRLNWWSRVHMKMYIQLISKVMVQTEPSKMGTNAGRPTLLFSSISGVCPLSIIRNYPVMTAGNDHPFFTEYEPPPPTALKEQAGLPDSVCWALEDHTCTVHVLHNSVFWLPKAVSIVSVSK